MTKNDKWEETITPELEDKLLIIAQASYRNACDILKDSITLYEAGSIPRAGALAILSEEEFSKSFVFVICVNEHRWDSEIFLGVKRHPEKQSISESMREYVKWFIGNYNRVKQMNKSLLYPMTPARMPGHVHLNDWLHRAKKSVKKAKKEKYKQSLIYVDFNKQAQLTSEPRQAKIEDVEECINEAKKIKEVVEIILKYQTDNFKKIEI
jgi:AbiV family abortive infection protein